MAIRMLALAALTSLVLLNPAHTHAAPKSGEPRPDVVIVRLNVPGASIEAINAEYGTTILDRSDEMPGVYLLRLAPGGDAPKTVYRMLNDRRFLYAELDAVSKPPVAHPRSISGWGGLDSTAYTQQPVATGLGLARAQAITRGAGTVVAVLDSGVQLDHPMLASSFTEMRYDFVDNDADPTDVANGLDDDADGLIDEAYGHGTHIAGIVHLVAPDARLMPVRVLDADGWGYVFTVAKALAWATHHGAQIINLSLGTLQPSLVLQDAVADARKSGVIVIAAAGNTDWLTQQFPAADPNAVAITSVNSTGQKSSFANYGSWVDLAAPGENIVSTYPGNGYATWSGTSMATPFASGQAALIRSVNPAWAATDVITLMQQTATPLRTLDRQYAQLLGAGCLDIGTSVEVALASTAAITSPSPLKQAQQTTKAQGLLK